MSLKPEFSIPVHDVDAAGRHLDLPIRAAWLREVLDGTDVRPADDGNIDLRLSRSGRDVVVRGRVAVRLLVPCARCLEPACISVNEELTALAVHAASEAPGLGPARDPYERELGPEEADSIPYDGETLNLDELVRDEILLGIPMIPLCSEACTGISPPPADGERRPFGADLDPRLVPLLNLKKI